MLDVALPFNNPPFSVWSRRPSRPETLKRLAREVETAQPGLASDLRGIALHEEAAAPAAVAATTPVWRRAARSVWSALVAYGEGRARRDLLCLAERWESTQPELAKDLRAACERNA